jgi:hypothetical protein
MTLFDGALYLVRLFFYWLRLGLFYLYHVLLALSKPGSVMIHAALLIGLCWWQYERIPSTFIYRWWVDDILQYYTPHYPVDQPYWYMGLFVAVFTFCHYILVGGKFKLLGSILGVFPQIRRPLPPAMPLRIKEHKILPAAVSLAVPKLKRSRRSRRAPDFTAHLSEPLQKLLEPPAKPLEHQEAPKPQRMPPEPPKTAQEPTPQAPQSPPASPPTPQAPAKEEAKARPTRKPPPLPPKAKPAE